MSEVAALMAAFHEATGREAAIWERRDGSVTPTLIGTSSAVFAALTEAGAMAWDVNSWARTQRLHAQLVATGESVGWLFVEPGITPEGDRLLGRLVPFVRRLSRERDGAASELVERYEEINLLYAIGELLGGTTSVEGVADTLLRELAVTVGASRAVFLLTNRADGMLRPIASLGVQASEYAPVSLDDASHIAVRPSARRARARRTVRRPSAPIHCWPPMDVRCWRSRSRVRVRGWVSPVRIRRLAPVAHCRRDSISPVRHPWAS